MAWASEGADIITRHSIASQVTPFPRRAGSGTKTATARLASASIKSRVYGEPISSSEVNSTVIGRGVCASMAVADASFQRQIIATFHIRNARAIA